MLEHDKACVLGQFEAALWMLNDCISKCPPEHWSGPSSIIGKYEFWHVVHHTLTCTDEYFSINEQAIESRPEFHPAGDPDRLNEYPSRTFSKDEMLKYIALCLARLRDSLAAETDETFRGGSGFSWVKTSRAELYLYSMRHVMHHTGQLSAFLRRLNLDKDHQPRWKHSGWE